MLPLLVEAVVAPMRDGARRHGRGAIWCMLLACGVGCFVAPPRVGLYQVSSQRCRACLRLSLKNMSFWEVATTVANAANSTTGSYLTEVNRTATAFLQRRDAVDRDDAIANLCEQMQIKGRLCLVLGGKNLGKTLLKEKAIARCKAAVNILSVNMRDADMLGKDLMTALNLQRLKSLGWARLSLEMLGAVIRLPVNYALKISGLSQAGAVAKEALGVATSHCQVNIDNFISRSRKIPSIIIDEANLALPGMNAGDGSVVAGSALQALTKWTKETSQASVILVSSEFGYPFRLQAAGLDLRDTGNIIVIGEVPESDMLKMLKDDWSMDEDLAEMFYNYFGGDIYTTKQALDSLIRKKDTFDPFAVVRCPGLPSCVENAAARAHLENIAKQGFSLVKNVKTDEGARMIAQENVGGVIDKDAITFGLPTIFTGADTEWAVIPSSYHMKLLIARKLQQIPLPTSGGTGTAQPAVWVRQIRKDGDTFEQIGNAFPIDPVPFNIAYLKKAIKAEKPNKVKCDADEIDIFSQQDGKWIKEEKMSASLRDTDETDCYGFTLPSV
ncbi:unnamed protein product [Durusdinium trenchii]|uniref:Uncharacterized protein n=1 Tax=Durusdinium trenchii TaxID=1381693 RepID=A0ABP0PNC6_9DINO